MTDSIDLLRRLQRKPLYDGSGDDIDSLVDETVDTCIAEISRLRIAVMHAEKELLWAADQFDGGAVLNSAANECRCALRVTGNSVPLDGTDMSAATDQ